MKITDNVYALESTKRAYVYIVLGKEKETLRNSIKINRYKFIKKMR